MTWMQINFILGRIQDQDPHLIKIDPKHWSLLLLLLLLLLFLIFLILFKFNSRIILKVLSGTDLNELREVFELTPAGSNPISLIQILIDCFKI